MSTTCIRKVDNSDPLIQLMLKDMDKECLPGCPDPEVGTGTWWVVLDKKQPVGYACIRESLRMLGWGYMSRAGVIPAYRGQGLQKRLIQTRLSYAKKAGWEGVVTDTSKDNVASSNSLIACGFRLYRPKFLWSFENALYWRKELS